MRSHERNIIFLTCLFSTISFFLIDFYLPSFPNMAVYFNVNASETKYLVSSFLLGIGLSQPIYGVLSDRFGRKSILILGITLSLMANTIALFVGSIQTLLIFRWIAGLGAGACPAIARAVLSDSFSGKELLKSNSYLSMSITMSPAIAPVIGGVLEQLGGWKYSFTFISLWCFISLVLLLVRFNETLGEDKRTSMKVSILKKNTNMLLTDRAFLTSSIISCFTIASGLSYFTISPFIFQNQLHLSPVVNGLVYILNALACFAGANYVKNKSQTMLPEQLLKLGVQISIVGSLLMLAIGLTGIITISGMVLPMLIVNFAFGLIMPTTGTIAIRKFKDIGGISAAMLGSIRMAGSSLIIFIVAFMNIQNQTTLALLVLSLFTIASFLRALGSPVPMNANIVQSL